MFISKNELAAIDRSAFYIYKLSDEIIYQESLTEQCRSMAVLPEANTGSSQEILIGGAQTSWRYKARRVAQNGRKQWRI